MVQQIWVNRMITGNAVECNEDREKTVTFGMGKDDGKKVQFIPFIYASVCPCAAPSVSPAVTVVPILSFFSQVTNSLISTYETTDDIT